MGGGYSTTCVEIIVEWAISLLGLPIAIGIIQNKLFVNKLPVR